MIEFGSDKNGIHSWPLGSKNCVFEYFVHFVGFVITALHKLLTLLMRISFNIIEVN